MDAGEPADVFRAVVIGVAPSWSRRSNRAYHRWAVRRRRSGGQLKVRGGLGPRSSAAGQTTTGTNALEVDMPPRHQRNTVLEAAGGGHAFNCATDTRTSPNRGRFALTVSKSPPWQRRTFRTARNLVDLLSGTERSAERTCESGLGNWLHDSPNGIR